MPAEAIFIQALGSTKDDMGRYIRLCIHSTTLAGLDWGAGGGFAEGARGDFIATLWRSTARRSAKVSIRLCHPNLNNLPWSSRNRGVMPRLGAFFANLGYRSLGRLGKAYRTMQPASSNLGPGRGKIRAFMRAEGLFREASEIDRRSNGPGQSEYATCSPTLAEWCLVKLDRQDEHARLTNKRSTHLSAPLAARSIPISRRCKGICQGCPGPLFHRRVSQSAKASNCTNVPCCPRPREERDLAVLHPTAVNSMQPMVQTLSAAGLT